MKTESTETTDFSFKERFLIALLVPVIIALFCFLLALPFILCEYFGWFGLIGLLPLFAIMAAEAADY